MTTRIPLGRPQGTLADAVWRAVTTQAPCPICGGNAGCFVHEEDAFASCVQHASDWPLINGTWLHPLAAPGSPLAQAG